MTELEKIERAKVYMDKLANGVNPVDDSVVPDEDVVNNVRLSRCFFFVADVLEQVIENGGIQPAATGKKAKKRPLEIPFEKRMRFEYSEKPIPASEIAKRVNALRDDENMGKLSYSGIVEWLVEIGMMEEADMPDGKKTKRPTTIGRENGISVEERLGTGGAYQVVVYNRAAQQFVVDNLDAIIAAKNNCTELRGTPWTPEQDERAADMCSRAVPIREIAAEMKRSPSAVRKRLKKLGFDL